MISDRLGGDFLAFSIGIDIGTTTLSAAVYDIDSKKLVYSCSAPHGAQICQNVYFEQDVCVILEKAYSLLCNILASYGETVGIGITGQMHGIVYVNDEGEPISNLITWQDKRGDIPLADGKSACQKIEEITGERIATGYGIATHYYNMQAGRVPENAAGFCSIMDLFAMRICKIKRALTHTSVAASFGLFDAKNGVFMNDKLELLGIDVSLLPEVTSKASEVGKYGKIPVYVSIGDNQASFLGAAGEDAHTLVVNIGTGSQVSAISDFCAATGALEIRPFTNGKYLLCGSALCGGHAYSMLESFFRDYMSSAGANAESQYEIINKLALKAYESKNAGLCVDTSFFGKRNDPSVKGAITGIDTANFTPEALVIGVLNGMVNELYELCGAFGIKKARIIASGGAIRKNEVLRALISDKFGMPVSVSETKEEAALGAAIFAQGC